MTQGQYVKAITIGRGGTRAYRSPGFAEQWIVKVQAIHDRAKKAMLACGAVDGDMVFPLPDSDTLRNAARVFYATLTAKQKHAITAYARGGCESTPGTVLDLFEGVRVVEGSVLCFDECVPLGAILWPDPDQPT